MSKTIEVLVMEGYELYEKKVSSLEEKQSIVEGNLDCCSLPHGIDVWFNDEFLFSEKGPTTLLLKSKDVSEGLYINGPVFLAGVTEDGGTTSLSDVQKRWVEDNIIYYPVPLSDQQLLVIHGYDK